MADFATIDDIIALKRALTSPEQERAEALLPVVSSIIRAAGDSYGFSIDDKVASDTNYANLVKAVAVDVVMRELNTPGGQMPATQYTESAGGMSQSYTLPNSSGAITLWPSDKKRLGLSRQKIGSLNLMGGCR